jgi:hypothetical protein
MESKNYSPEKLPAPYRHYFTKKFTREDLTARIQQELEESPLFKEFAASYRPDSVTSFTKYYAEKKTSVLLDSEQARNRLEFGDSVFRTYAEERLWDIQQKKLFDLQCLWRAEKITIAEIESTWDFHYWSENIKSCPFLEPITGDEVSLYIEFLKSCTEELHTFHEWQAYDEIKEEQTSDEGGMIPEWYEYHNNHTGNGVYLTFPDVRGEKEEFYRKIWADHNTKVSKEAEEKYVPYLFAIEENVKEVMSKIETPEYRKMYARYERMQQILMSQEDVEDAYAFLTQLYQEVPIDASHDWRIALVNAKNRYINQKIAEELPVVFEEYQMKRSLGIAVGEDEEKDKSFYDSLKNPVREGRKLNGEPPDFSF